MIHDFAKLPRTHAITGEALEPRPRRVRRLPKIRWVLGLLVIALLTYWRTHASTGEPPVEFEPGVNESREYQQALEAQQREQAELERQRAAALQAKAQEQVAESQYDFYESLSESAWRVPVQRGVYVTEEDRQRAKQRYMLQAASVRDLAQAQQLVQKLRQLGLQAFYTHDEAGGWYRVNVGPFDNVSKMNKAEDILVAQRMMPLKRRL